MAVPVLTTSTKRSKTTCVQCRVRKRSPEGPGNGDGASPAESSQIQLERRRGALACIECRSQKTRCPGDLPACGKCVRRGRDCVYPTPKRPTRGAKPTASPGAQEEANPLIISPSPTQATPGASTVNLLPPVNETLTLFDAYFEHVYPLPWYAFLHKRSVVQRYLDGTIEECLPLAICAVTTQRLKFDRYSAELSASWAQRAEDYLMQTLENPSTSRLQALVLIVRYRVEAGNFSKAFMLAALAGRCAVALRLNYERPGLRFLVQEVRRRIMWSCFLLDSNFSVGLREYEICPPEILYLQLPCPETEFEDDTPVKTPPLRAVSTKTAERLGVYAACLRLVSIRRDIMMLTRRLTSSRVEPRDLMRSVQQFENELDHLYQSLADFDRYSSTMFTHGRKQVRLLIVHQSWHLTHCDLYRIFLTGYRESAPASALEGIDSQEILRIRGLCLQHALSIVQILQEFSEQSPAQTVDFDTAYHAYHATRIILFTTQPAVVAQPLSVAAALEKARFCQRMLERYFPASPVVEPMKKEMEFVIGRYASRFNATGSLLLPQPEEAIDEDPRQADEARIRQRLGIHSLIRRADFVDDSNEVTSPAPNFQARSSAIRHTLSVQQPERRSQRTSSVIYRAPQRTLGTHGTTPSRNNAADSAKSRSYQQQNNVAGNANNEPASYAEERPDQSSDEMRFAFNPWMGWPETLETYGFPQGVDDDYF
ncbi:hypothetical protein A1O3_02728 [Capronia epimyces CBS 606.96]|uniref:Zn(2)-C6 fungal-type domain-containing protein n=1 Tax=Capronia epimyces CBS 606.96 TaxID=1182542 RepID=W9YK87_9EURO|nr:uncharacterized protein A1O3_02728 [Capronia epimyces CBS 606.96]EXJ89661.1 hypothetical protein A1O3_02728 [Capronia epimyces CBS 606.96]